MVKKGVLGGRTPVHKSGRNKECTETSAKDETMTMEDKRS